MEVIDRPKRGCKRRHGALAAHACKCSPVVDVNAFCRGGRALCCAIFAPGQPFIFLLFFLLAGLLRRLFVRCQ